MVHDFRKDCETESHYWVIIFTYRVYRHVLACLDVQTSYTPLTTALVTLVLNSGLAYFNKKYIVVTSNPAIKKILHTQVGILCLRK
jgi:hypothetical protein